jgi:site-specific DNA recombinase
MSSEQLIPFAKGTRKNTTGASTAVMYTRVSTKEQADKNQSLFTQAKHIRHYALSNGLELLGEFGGTYESARNDERKEFKKMLDFVKRKKVHVIIVYSADRFSRSGPNAIYLSEKLRKLGTQILSVTQPIDASTAEGELQQSIYFMFSQYENQQRRMKCMAGTKEKLLQGEWVAKPPLGYKRVKNGTESTIEITQEGILLGKAFKLKIKNNYAFTDISIWLRKRGINLNHKRLSELARNVFYCGYMAHNALDGQIIKGNHKGIITYKEFIALNNVLQHRPTKINQGDTQSNLPLKGHLICSGCNQPMTGYYVRIKDLYYYKCNTKGCCVNRSAKMLHQKWEQNLSALQIDPKFVQPIIDLLKEKLTSTQKESVGDLKTLKKKQTELKKKFDKLEERFVLGEIEPDLYKKYRAKFKEDMDPISLEIEKIQNPLSNLDISLEKIGNLLSNLLNIWEKGDITARSKFLKCVYPRGILLDKEKPHYRTFGLNPVIRYVSTLTRVSEETKKRNSEENITYSALVARSRIELPTSGL